MIGDGANAIMVGENPDAMTNRAMIARLIGAAAIPAMYAFAESVEAGGLMAYGVNYPDLYFRSASLIDKIFRGANPGDLPVEQPTKLEFIINLKAAKAIGLEVPPLLIARADEVIE